MNQLSKVAICSRDVMGGGSDSEEVLGNTLKNMLIMIISVMTIRICLDLHSQMKKASVITIWLSSVVFQAI